VPPALLDAGLAGEGEVCVLEPRRLAARLVARRVAEERGETLGETVGYQVRFEEVAGRRTRLRFVTEGVLTRRLLSDPTLARVGCVVLDEFHERHLQADLALALLRRLQRTERPDLRLVAMSATLDAAPVARFLECESVRSEGRRFDVSVEHLPREDERPLAAQVAAAVERVVAEGPDGDVLVFLPGAAEIRRAQEACAGVAGRAGLLVLPLHGELPPAEQDRAVRPSERRKVILSTNVAETSVTIEGVVAVIDSGLARVASHSPWSGLPALKVARVSRSSATQRAGRAGRTRPGRCLRLYTAQDFNARPEHDAAEIHRLDLAEPALELHAAGVRDLSGFDWFEAPPADALASADALLRKLGAIDGGGMVTTLGRRMLRLPLHPRLARVVAEGESRGVGRDACLVAALISERDIRERELLSDARGQARPRESRTSGPSDLLALADLFAEAGRADFAPERVRRLGLSPGAVRNVERARRQLERAIKRHGEGVRRERAGEPRGGDDVRRGHKPDQERTNGDEREAALLVSILAGYPDRVARRRAKSGAPGGAGAEVLLAGGGAAELAPESVVRQAAFLVAVDAEERRAAGASRSRAQTVVRLASAVEPDWLLDLFAEEITETLEGRWNAQGERVETVSRMMYGGLVLDESRAPGATGPEVSRVLAEAALAEGGESFAEREGVEQFLARVDFVARTFPEAEFPPLGDEDVRATLAELCEGRRGFAELREAVRRGELTEALRRRLAPEQSRLLARAAPERVEIAGRRQARVNYERGGAPWIASRLQDFFGMREGPSVGAGRVPVVLRLLAPSQRPVQVTTDLAGFWQRHYPQVRRELSRRYPRHRWPENPLAPAPRE
jgi:ATP-dependent helicase HrpB